MGAEIGNLVGALVGYLSRGVGGLLNAGIEDQRYIFFKWLCGFCCGVLPPAPSSFCFFSFMIPKPPPRASVLFCFVFLREDACPAGFHLLSREQFGRLGVGRFFNVLQVCYVTEVVGGREGG